MNSKQTFKQIFLDHWDEFKKENPSYNDERYDECINKMIGCGDSNNGYTEFRCSSCGLDAKRVPFTCKSGFCLSSVVKELYLFKQTRETIKQSDLKGNHERQVWL